jgi:hypothetical protein
MLPRLPRHAASVDRDREAAEDADLDVCHKRRMRRGLPAGKRRAQSTPAIASAEPSTLSESKYSSAICLAARQWAT